MSYFNDSEDEAKMLQTKYEGLAGKVLVAAPQVNPKSYFSKRVIYVVKHATKNGAIGLIVNQPIVSATGNMAIKYKPQPGVEDSIEVSLGSVEAYTGGPLDAETGFILHTDHAIPKGNDIQISSSFHLLQNILNGTGPKHSMFLFGYCGWEHDQLEEEIKSNVWLVVEADKKLIFETSNAGKWDAALNNLNINPALYLTKAGNC